MDIYMERESLLVRVKIPFKKEEDILEDGEAYIKKYREFKYNQDNQEDFEEEERKRTYKVFIKFFEIVKNCNGIIKKEEIFYLKDKNYRTFLVKFGEVKNARTFNEIFFGLYPECKEQEEIFEIT